MKRMLSALLLLPACAPSHAPVETAPIAALEPTPPPAPPAPPSAGACKAENVQSLVGAPATADLVERVRRLSGAATVRRITPEMRVTMEYRADRMNVWVGLKGEAERIACG